MNSPWSLLLTFAATALLAGGVLALAYEFFFRYRLLIGERLDELAGKSKGNANTSLFKDLKSLSAQTAQTQENWRTRLSHVLEQSSLPIQLPALLGISLCLGIGLGAAIAVVTWRWWTAPAGLLVGLIAPLAFVLVKRALRIQRLAWQLPEAFDVIGRAVRAGQTVPAAFQIVADDFGGPISEEFRRCYEQQNLGIPHDTALRELARRTGVMELRILVVGLLVQSRSGGNLAELLGNLSLLARKRLKLQQKVRALTGEGRMQAAVLLVLPLISFASLLILSPDYVTALLQRPWLLVAALTAQVAGAIWIRRIVNFDY